MVVVVERRVVVPGDESFDVLLVVESLLRTDVGVSPESPAEVVVAPRIVVVVPRTVVEVVDDVEPPPESDAHPPAGAGITSPSWSSWPFSPLASTDNVMNGFAALPVA